MKKQKKTDAEAPVANRFAEASSFVGLIPLCGTSATGRHSVFGFCVFCVFRG